MKRNSVILIGMPGAGKSTIGGQVAKRLGLGFVDLDKVISAKTQKSIQALVESMGEEAFLKFEEEEMAALDVRNNLVAPGGSLIYNQALMQNLKKHAILVYLSD